MGGDNDDLADGRGREEGHNKILQEGIGVLEVDVGPAGEMGSLLEEEGMWTKYLADIDGDIQVLGRKDRVHDGDVGRGKVRGDGEDEEAGDGRVATELKTVDIAESLGDGGNKGGGLWGGRVIEEGVDGVTDSMVEGSKGGIGVGDGLVGGGVSGRGVEQGGDAGKSSKDSEGVGRVCGEMSVEEDEDVGQRGGDNVENDGEEGGGVSVHG